MNTQLPQPNAQIDWRLPEAQHDDWLFGTGATRSERILVWVSALLGLLIVGWHAIFVPPSDWHWWHYLIAALIALDVVGGVVANTLNSLKRLYFGPLRRPATPTSHLLHSTVGFTALHVHPIAIALLYPDGQLLWGIIWYLTALVSVAITRAVPLYLARPTAMLLFTTSFLLHSIMLHPSGWEWFIPLFLAKLVLAHAVREEPYRPMTRDASY